MPWRLSNCKSCNHVVDRHAKECPNCGRTDPATSALASFLGGTLMLGLIGWAVWALFGLLSEPTTAREVAADEAQKQAATQTQSVDYRGIHLSQAARHFQRAQLAADAGDIFRYLEELGESCDSLGAASI